MAVGREYSVLELDGGGPRLAAVSAVVGGDKIIIRRWLVADRPQTVQADSASAVGEWVGGELARAQFGKSRAILAVSRGDVVLKQLPVPNAGSLSDEELAGLVKLQMVRQLTMPMDGTAVDYLPPKRAAGTGASGASGHTRGIMAGAMPADRMAWFRGVADAAGLKIRRIGLRCFGAAALLADISQRRAGPVLGVAMGGGSTEFIVVEDGQLTFARAMDIARPLAIGHAAEWDAFAERVAVEAKRTWMSYRAGQPGGEPELVAVIGEGALSRLVGEACAVGLRCTWGVVGLPGFVEVPARMSEGDRALLAPLIGLLGETLLNRQSLDFANPRKLPDSAAKRRQLVLVGLLSAIVLGGVGYVMADQRLSRLRLQAVEARATENTLRQDLDKYMVRHAKVNHFEQWASAKVDYLAHIKRLHEELPDPTSGVVDDLSGRLLALTSFSPASGGGSRYPDGKWGMNGEVTLDVAGKVATRRAASELREKLLNTNLYGVESRGPDVPDHFAMQMTSGQLSPGAAVAAATKPGAAKDKTAADAKKKNAPPAPPTSPTASPKAGASKSAAPTSQQSSGGEP